VAFPPVICSFTYPVIFFGAIAVFPLYVSSGWFVAGG
jgi:hypothetical protein